MCVYFIIDISLGRIVWEMEMSDGKFMEYY